MLRDPKQKRFFKSKDIHDLFTLGPQYAGASETASIFSSLHGGLEVPLDPDSLAAPAESSQAAQAGGHLACLRSYLTARGGTAGAPLHGQGIIAWKRKGAVGVHSPESSHIFMPGIQDVNIESLP